MRINHEKILNRIKSAIERIESRSKASGVHIVTADTRYSDLLGLVVVLSPDVEEVG